MFAAAQPLTKANPKLPKKVDGNILKKNRLSTICILLHWGFSEGVYNYNDVPWYAKKAMAMDRPRVVAAYKEAEPGVYDTRDWDAIRSWAEKLADKILTP